MLPLLWEDYVFLCLCIFLPWASYQIVKFRWRMRRECRERFTRHRLQRKPLVSDPGMHLGTCVTHVGIANPRWREKRSRRMRDAQVYASGKGPIVWQASQDMWKCTVMYWKYTVVRRQCRLGLLKKIIMIKFLEVHVTVSSRAPQITVNLTVCRTVCLG